MATAFVLVRTNPVKELEVHKKLAAMSEIKELVPLFGEYDFILKLNDNYNVIGSTILERIRTVEGVVDTITLPTMEFKEQ